MCMALPETVTFTRDEALDILAAVEGARQLLGDTEFVGALLELDEATALLFTKLYNL